MRVATSVLVVSLLCWHVPCEVTAGSATGAASLRPAAADVAINTQFIVFGTIRLEDGRGISQCVSSELSVGLPGRKATSMKCANQTEQMHVPYMLSVPASAADSLSLQRHSPPLGVLTMHQHDSSSPSVGRILWQQAVAFHGYAVQVDIDMGQDQRQPDPAAPSPPDLAVSLPAQPQSLGSGSVTRSTQPLSTCLPVGYSSLPYGAAIQPDSACSPVPGALMLSQASLDGMLALLGSSPIAAAAGLLRTPASSILGLPGGQGLACAAMKEPVLAPARAEPTQQACQANATESPSGQHPAHQPEQDLQVASLPSTTMLVYIAAVLLALNIGQLMWHRMRAGSTKSLHLTEQPPRPQPAPMPHACIAERKSSSPGPAIRDRPTAPQSHSPTLSVHSLQSIRSGHSMHSPGAPQQPSSHRISSHRSMAGGPASVGDSGQPRSSLKPKRLQAITTSMQNSSPIHRPSDFNLQQSLLWARTQDGRLARHSLGSSGLMH